MLGIQTRGRRMEGPYGYTELWRPPTEKTIFIKISIWGLIPFLPIIITTTPILMAFTGVTNANEPSSQPTANRSPTYSLITTTGSNQI